MLTDKIISWGKIAEVADHLHQKGKKIVFTNGCFDILHAGHVLYLDQAKSLGDILILGLNSDASVKRLKGNERPINTQENRAIVLAGLSAVDFIVVFQEDTPLELIKIIQPDVLVKGGDWKPKDIVGSDIVLAKGGEVRSLSFTAGLSSTNTLAKMRKIDG